jgi:hypothetical protein
MTETEIRLRIYEMAFERAKLEKPENFLDRVATVATWLQNRIIGEPEAQSKARSRADKSAS